MNDILAIWSDWVRPSAGLPTVQWALLLAVAAAAGHLVQRHLQLPKVVGYSVVGALAGLAGFSGATWPLGGISLFLLELGVSIVLFEAGGRTALRWLWRNPMVLMQSLLGSLLAYAGVYFAMRWMGLGASVAQALAAIAIVGAPAVLSRVSLDIGASGPVTDRAMTLTTLGALYALVLVSARTSRMDRLDEGLVAAVLPMVAVLGVSLLVAGALAMAFRLALRFMTPTSENTSILLLSLLAAGTTVAAHLGGSAPLAALLAGLLLKHVHQRPWAWPRQLGTAASALVMLTFVLVSVVAAQAPWNPAVAGLVLVFIAARSAGQLAGVAAANAGSGLHWRQALWTAGAMTPLSSVALLLVAQFAASSTLGPLVASIALPAILLMESVGAIITTLVLNQARESSRTMLSHEETVSRAAS
jgi:Kef-type K+ transport system membrane component KefB